MAFDTEARLSTKTRGPQLGKGVVARIGTARPAVWPWPVLICHRGAHVSHCIPRKIWLEREFLSYCRRQRNC